jgi:hypothetical protein
MEITFKCKSCHTTYRVKPALAGRTAECAKCGHRCHIPYRSPVVKLGEEFVSDDDLGGSGEPDLGALQDAAVDSAASVAAAAGVASPASSSASRSGAPAVRTFDEYEHLRKPGKVKVERAPDEPFVPVPAVVTDVWLPIGLCLVFYGASAYLALSYVLGSHGVGAGVVISILTGLLFWAGLMPLTVRVVEGAAGAFDFKPSNALWLQVLGALSLPAYGTLFGMFANGANAAVAFGLVGLIFGALALSVMLQTSIAKAAQAAGLAAIAYAVSSAAIALIVWGLSVQLIPAGA